MITDNPVLVPLERLYGDINNEARVFKFKSMPAELGLFKPRDFPKIFSDAGCRAFPIIAQSINLNEYDHWVADINLLQLAFLISCDQSPIITHFIYPNEPKRNGRPEEFIKTGWKREKFCLGNRELQEVDDYLGRLKEMYGGKQRAKNAIEFLLRGCYCKYWFEAYVLWSCALECVFGLEKTGRGIADTMSRRISSYTDLAFSYQEAMDFYDDRSRIVHGRFHLFSKSNRTENLQRLNSYWKLVRYCFKNLLDKKGYQHMDTEKQRESYFDTYCQNSNS